MSGGEDSLAVALCSAKDDLREILEAARRKFKGKTTYLYDLNPPYRPTLTMMGLHLS